MEKQCKALNEHGQPCGTPPIIGEAFCFWHHPDYERQAADARRAGGANRAREQTLKAVFDLTGVKTVEELQRVVEIALIGLMGLENSVGRNRALLSVASTGRALIETGELAEQVAQLKAVLEPRLPGEQKKKWFGRR